MASNIFLHPGELPIICSCAKSACWVKPGYHGWPQHLIAQGTKARGADSTGPANALAGPLQSVEGFLAYPLPFAFPAGWVAGGQLKYLGRQFCSGRASQCLPRTVEDALCLLGRAWRVFASRRKEVWGAAWLGDSCQPPQHGSELSCKLL